MPPWRHDERCRSHPGFWKEAIHFQVAVYLKLSPQLHGSNLLYIYFLPWTIKYLFLSPPGAAARIKTSMTSLAGILLFNSFHAHLGVDKVHTREWLKVPSSPKTYYCYINLIYFRSNLFPKQFIIFSTNSFSSTEADLYKAKQMKRKTSNQVTSWPMQCHTNVCTVRSGVRPNLSAAKPRVLSQLGQVSPSTLPVEATKAQRREHFYF